MARCVSVRAARYDDDCTLTTVSPPKSCKDVAAAEFSRTKLQRVCQASLLVLRGAVLLTGVPHVVRGRSAAARLSWSSRMKVKVPQRVAAHNSSEKSARHENSLTSKLAVSASPTKNCSDVRSRTMYDVSVVTLTRTDTTLDHSQKAEKVCWQWTEPFKLQCKKLKRCGDLVQAPPCRFRVATQNQLRNNPAFRSSWSSKLG